MSKKILVSLVVAAAAVVLTVSPAEAQKKKSRGSQAPASVQSAPAASQPMPVPAAVEASTLEAPSRETEVRKDFHIEAYIEPELRLVNKEDKVTDPGFTLNDGAIYLTKSFGRSEAVIDIPFDAISTAGNDLSLGQKKAQAYFNFERDIFFVKAGQFDTPFGMEHNDSRDRFFMDWGAIKEYQLVPVTHMGLQAGVSVQNGLMTFVGQVTNPDNLSGKAKANPAFGGQFRLNTGAVYGAAGIRLYENKDVADKKTDILVDLMGGFSTQSFNLAGEFDYRKVAGTDKSAIGIGVLGTVQATEDFGIGGRFEYLKDIPAVLESGFQVSGGVSYRLEPGVLLRSDFTIANGKVPNASDETIFGLSAGILVTL